MTGNCIYKALFWSAENFALQPCLSFFCTTLNSCIQALKQSRFKSGYLFEECYFGATMGRAKIVKIKCLLKIPVKNTSYTIVRIKPGFGKNAKIN